MTSLSFKPYVLVSPLFSVQLCLIQSPKRHQKGRVSCCTLCTLSTTWTIPWTFNKHQWPLHTKFSWPFCHLGSSAIKDFLPALILLSPSLSFLSPPVDVIHAAFFHSQTFCLAFPSVFLPCTPNPSWSIPAGLCYVSHSRASLMGTLLPVSSINTLFPHSVLLIS